MYFNSSYMDFFYYILLCLRSIHIIMYVCCVSVALTYRFANQFSTFSFFHFLLPQRNGFLVYNSARMCASNGVEFLYLVQTTKHTHIFKQCLLLSFFLFLSLTRAFFSIRFQCDICLKSKRVVVIVK